MTSSPTSTALRDLATRWSAASAGERANAQLYLTELTEALGVERPRPRGAGYEFEHPVRVGRRDGTETTNFIDLYKEGCYVLEAKHEDEDKSTNALLQRAFGQARTYATNLPGAPPPYLMVLDVGRTLLVWDRWSGTYGGFKAAQAIDLRRLHERPEEIELLRDIWTRPDVRNPRKHAVAVTKEIATQLAQLAAQLEKRGYEQEQVARYLIRCVFTMFAEDTGLLPEKLFQQAVEQIGLEDPAGFAEAIGDLWRAMDEGKRFYFHKLLRFNGHFFRDVTTLTLTRDEVAILLRAARADWRQVEPSIFGTLLTRALDPVERHRLGAEYTPREYVERVVRPTVEEPIREHWTRVQAEVLQLRESGRKKDVSEALKRLRDFHTWLRGLRFLDPACGSGNFLYVTLDIVKRVELEVLRTIEEITEQPELAVEEVGPWQFYGIEIKAWARELAELTLWIGYHQFWKAHHGGVQPPEPVLRDTGTLKCRDAVLAWDEIVEDPARARPDPTHRIPHPVTGKLVPDPEARLPYMAHINAQPAEWPQADFIIGNPPYLGQARQRDAFGDGYVEALRAAYPKVPETADYVMYWWYRAAEEIAEARTIRAGLITTNTITQAQNRVVIERAAEKGVGVAWAIPAHPWVDESGAADVRVAMTVFAREPAQATRIEVDDAAQVTREIAVERLNADLTAHADVARATTTPLLANQGLASPGFKLHGSGFILPAAEATTLLDQDARHADIIKQYRNGRDLASRPRGVYVMDFGLQTEEEARENPVLYGLVRDRVKPERDANARESRRRYWWRFGEPNPNLRQMLAGLPRYIVTGETSKHRFFVFLDSDVAPDNMLVCIASEEAFHLGVLSSTAHVTWSLAAGGRLGVGNDPRYNKTRCFDPFPFPEASAEFRAQMADAAERLDRHRWEALARDAKITMTGMYNVLEKLRSGEQLTPAERKVHEIAACGVLRDMHDELDRLVAEAYGWPWPLEREEVLERLVTLHDERVEEEKRGVVRWLRPEYQVPRFGGGPVAAEMEITTSGDTKTDGAATERQPWPATVIEQIAVLQQVLPASGLTAAEAAAAFAGARVEHVERHLETLAMMGELQRAEDGRYVPVLQSSVAA